ncbi:MAG: hypothetical protein UT05_C0006G0037 [Parcubacteria group bacterium GW2011_GWF2_38_76]|nr:MAG: hypothetical protein UT05_C0006G0037 [Parcubacteria group bacterium GW2011_GWF2_38_76]
MEEGDNMISWELCLSLFLGSVVSLFIKYILDKCDKEKALFAQVQVAKTSDEVRKIIMQGKLNSQHHDEAFEKLILLCDQERISGLAPKLAEAKTFEEVEAIYYALPEGDLKNKAEELKDSLFLEELRAELDKATTSREVFKVYEEAPENSHLELEAELKYKELLTKEIAECNSLKELKYIIIDEQKESFFDHAVCRYAEIMRRSKERG